MNEKQTPASSTRTTPDESTILPTKKQKELLAFIDTFIATNGFSPSYREIMNGLQYTSVATVALHVGNLIKRGHLRKREHNARSLEVLTHSDMPLPQPLKTNEVKESEEKWLVSKVEQFMAEAELETQLTRNHLDNLYVLLGALRVLGLDGAAQSFAHRMSALKKRLAAVSASSAKAPAHASTEPQQPLAAGTAPA